MSESNSRKGGRSGPRSSGSPRAGRSGHRGNASRPALRLFTTTLWEYPSQHFDAADGSSMQGDKAYVGATPSWVIWQLLSRYTRERDLVVDPMCGSGTTIDVARGLDRKALGYDLAPTRDDIFRADARKLPLENAVADFAFIDPPYSTHVDYSDDPRCIGKLDAAAVAAEKSGGGGGGDRAGPHAHAESYYDAMTKVVRELHRVLKPNRYMAMYVSDSWRKRKGDEPEQTPPSKDPAHAHFTKGGVFMPIGFELYSIMRTMFTPIDIIAVVRHNDKLNRGNWHKAAEEQNFFLRGFNYLFIMKK